MHKIVVNRRDSKRQLGFGRTDKLPKKISVGDAGFGAAVDMISSGFKCPPQQLPIVHQTQGTLTGAVSDTAITKTFGAEIKPFTWDEETPGFTQVSSTLWEGETLAPYIVYGVGVHLEVCDQSLVAKGNYQVAAFGATAQPNFGSPDSMTATDKLSGAWLDNTGAPHDVTSVMFPAVLRYGSSWQAQMFWHFCRAFNFQWKVANNVSIIDNSMRTLAYTPSDASGGTASSSEMDVNDITRECNDYYGSKLGAAGIFRKTDRIRLGCLVNGLGITGPTNPGVGSFSASRADETLGVTYGSFGVGAALSRDLKNNSEYLKLDCPYILGSGKQIGIQFRQVDDVQAAAFRKQLAASNGTSGQTIPPYVSDAAQLSGTQYDGSGMWEQTLDGSTGYNQKMDGIRYVFKYGPAKITVRLLGQEVSEDMFATITDPDVRAALTSACGVQFPGFTP